MKKEKVLEEIEINADIQKDVSILDDGRQLMIKIPKEITDFLNMEKGDKLRLKIEIPKDTKEQTINTFEVIKNA